MEMKICIIVAIIDLYCDTYPTPGDTPLLSLSFSYSPTPILLDSFHDERSAGFDLLDPGSAAGAL